MSEERYKVKAVMSRSASVFYDGDRMLMDYEILAALAERDRLRAELAAIKARVHDAYLREPDAAKSAEAATGDGLLDRLAGIYTSPVNDGAGPLNGSMEFTRRFPTLPLNLEARAEIVRLRAELEAEQELRSEVARDLLSETGYGWLVDAKPCCWKCWGDKPATMMLVCPTCGNKRCPKASDHELACTNSNEPGQPGSVYR